jgi:hypothetical protein
LALLELADRDPAPAIRGADYRRVHQLEHRALACATWSARDVALHLLGMTSASFEAT